MIGSKRHILVVDDERAILEMVRRKLTACGHDCTTAGDVCAALDSISQSVYDLVLLDILLPDGSGLELLAHFRLRHPGVAVIMMTGVVDPDTVEKARQEGALEYLTKPFDLDKLASLVDHALEPDVMQTRSLGHG